jgi:hypothetical protein
MPNVCSKGHKLVGGRVSRPKSLVLVILIAWRHTCVSVLSVWMVVFVSIVCSTDPLL